MSDSDTAFPEGALRHYGTEEDTSSFITTVDMDEIHRWFKRCMAECPAVNDYPTYDGGLWGAWFDKWFSQFKGEG